MNRIPPIRAALSALTAVYLTLVASLWFTSDAAWIDARYARNLARGIGPRFNAADTPVEAWSSPLGVALGAGFEAAGLPSTLLLQALSVACGIALLWVLFQSMTDRLDIRPAVALGAVATLAFSPMIAAWTTGMPMTVPGVLLLYVAFDRWVLARDGAWGAVGLAAAAGLVLARHDGLIWALAIVALGLAARLSEHRRVTQPLPRAARPDTRSFSAALGTSAVALVGLGAALAILRLQVFGSAVPWAIARLDANPLTGLNYLLASAFGVGLPLWWFGCLAFRGGRDRMGSATALLVLGAVLVVVSGGESDPFARMLLPMAPFGTLIVARLAEQQVAADRSGTALWLVLFALLFGHLPAWDLPLAPRRIRQATDLRPDTARTRTEIGHWRFVRENGRTAQRLASAVRLAAGPDASWTAGSPGVRGYVSDLHIHDLSGLTDPTAHAAKVGDRARRAHFMAQTPTVLRARLIADKPVATLLADDWASAHDDYAARVLKQPDKTFLVLQERADP